MRSHPRSLRQVPVSPALAYVPIMTVPGTDANQTASMIDEKLKGTEGKMKESLIGIKDELKKSQGEMLEGQIANAMSKADKNLDNKLSEKTSALEGSIHRTENAVQSRLDSLQNESKQHLSEVSKTVATQSRELHEKMDIAIKKLENLERFVDIEFGKRLSAMCRVGTDEGLTLTSHHDQMYSELNKKYEHLIRNIQESKTQLNDSLSYNRESIANLINAVKRMSDQDRKVQKDEYIKSQLNVRLEVADDVNPSVGKLLPLTPIVAARKLRQMWNAKMGKGMVSVCYHNQPRPLADEHPLVENDDPLIRSIFNGTMDSAHNLQAGLNLDTPAYINSLLMEVQSLDREYVSLCLEDPRPDVDFYHETSCMNLVIGKK